MSLFLFIGWWDKQEWTGQFFWMLAVVSTFLLFIRLGLSLFGEEETENKTEKRRFEVRGLLIFLTFFSWTNIWALYLGVNPSRGLAYGFFFGLIAALLSRFIASLLPGGPAVVRAHKLNTPKILSSTGQVLKSIPPHRNGFGKVHLDLRGAPYSIDAVTAGQELTAGMAVRVIDVLDDQVVLVEPVESIQPRMPHPGESVGRG